MQHTESVFEYLDIFRKWLTCVDSIKSQMHAVMSMVTTRKYYEIT